MVGWLVWRKGQRRLRMKMQALAFCKHRGLRHVCASPVAFRKRRSNQERRNVKTMRLRAATRALFIAHWWLFRWAPRVRKSSFVGTYPLSCSRPTEIPSWLMYETFLRIGSPRTSHSTLFMKLYTGKRFEIAFCSTCYMSSSRIFIAMIVFSNFMLVNFSIVW